MICFWNGAGKVRNRTRTKNKHQFDDTSILVDLFFSRSNKCLNSTAVFEKIVQMRGCKVQNQRGLPSIPCKLETHPTACRNATSIQNTSCTLHSNIPCKAQATSQSNRSKPTHLAAFCSWHMTALTNIVSNCYEAKITKRSWVMKMRLHFFKRLLAELPPRLFAWIRDPVTVAKFMPIVMQCKTST